MYRPCGTRKVPLPAWSLPLEARGRLGGPRLKAALARLVDLKAALLAEARARGPDGPPMRVPQLARCSRDQLRRRMGQHWRCARTWSRRQVQGLHNQSTAELGPTARSAPATQRAGRRAASESTRWSTHFSPRAPVSLTRRLRRAVAVWPEEPGRTPAPTLLRRRHLLLHGHHAASPGAASLGAAMRGATMRRCRRPRRATVSVCLSVCLCVSVSVCVCFIL